MASIQHDFIVAALVRKIRQDAFYVTYLDGKSTDVGAQSFKIPPKIANHRPDVLGENEHGFFCIGEAKTHGDIVCDRTKNQLRDFYDLVKDNNKNKFYIGVPLKSKELLNNLLFKELSLLDNGQIHYTLYTGGAFASR